MNSHIFLSELLLWELKFKWTSKSSKCNCRGQNPFDYEVPYIIGKLLECKCLNWAHMTHLDTSNISYGPKKVKLAIKSIKELRVHHTSLVLHGDMIP